MPQAEVPKSMEKQTSHFYEVQDCLSVQHSDITVMGNAEILAWSYSLKIETSSGKQKQLDFKSWYDNFAHHLRPITYKHSFPQRKLSTNKLH